MRNDFGRHLQLMMVFFFIVGALLVFGAIKTAEYFNGGKQIESKELIIPIKWLTLENGKIDTVYVYRKP